MKFSNLIGLGVSLLWVLYACPLMGQEQHYIQKAWQEFEKEPDLQHYDSAITYLRKAENINPENQETHYLLGYALERAVSKDAKGMINCTWNNTKSFRRIS